MLEGAERVVARLASVGRPVISYEIRIIDEGDHDVGIGEVGEIIGRSEAMMKGYWNLPKETEEKLKGGWLRTGDLGRFDEDGYVYVVERKNDMIISGGVNVYSQGKSRKCFTGTRRSWRLPLSAYRTHTGESPRRPSSCSAAGSSVTADEMSGSSAAERLAEFQETEVRRLLDRAPKKSPGKILKKIVREFYKKQ